MEHKSNNNINKSFKNLWHSRTKMYILWKNTEKSNSGSCQWGGEKRIIVNRYVCPFEFCLNTTR